MKTKELIKYLQKEDKKTGGNSDILIDTHNLTIDDLKCDTVEINDIPYSSIQCSSKFPGDNEEDHTIFLIAMPWRTNEQIQKKKKNKQIQT